MKQEILLAPQLQQTELDASLIDAYLKIKYVTQGDWEVYMVINQYSHSLANYYQQHNLKSAAFITAWNPRSYSIDNDKNRNLNECLYAQLLKLSEHVLPGIGSNADSNWPPEESFLVLGLSREQAIELGYVYEQNAIVWIEEDAIPRLLCLY